MFWLCHIWILIQSDKIWPVPVETLRGVWQCSLFGLCVVFCSYPLSLTLTVSLCNFCFGLKDQNRSHWTVSPCLWYTSINVHPGTLSTQLLLPLPLIQFLQDWFILEALCQNHFQLSGACLFWYLQSHIVFIFLIAFLDRSVKELITELEVSKHFWCIDFFSVRLLLTSLGKWHGKQSYVMGDVLSAKQTQQGDQVIKEEEGKLFKCLFIFQLYI